MCGIVGVVHLNKAPMHRERDAAILRASAAQISHRGPDDEQLHLWENVGLAFRRLAIVDLEGGRQPLTNEDESLLLICNGEIYNHKDLQSTLTGSHQFRSGSDCEIILHLYEDFGLDYIRHLNGMFASALLDKRRKRLILARDRSGIKPLFYYKSKNLLFFGSEIKAVLTHPEVPKEFDWNTALSFRNTMDLPKPEREVRSFFQKIHYLSGGHFIEVDLETGRITQGAYWDPEELAFGRDTPVLRREEYIEKYRHLLADSVKLQLMSDVEIGVFLSGGIDSVAIACFASKYRQFHTFTVHSQSTVTNGDAISAHKAAKTFGLPNHQVLFDWRDLRVTPADWKKILWQVETHMAGAEQIYKYNLHTYAKSQRPGLKVMLGGTGSDEFNGGYSKSVYNSSNNPSWQVFGAIMRDTERASLIYQSGALNPYVNIQAKSHHVISIDFLAQLTTQKPYKFPWHGYLDMSRYKLQMYHLWHEDRTAAANNIENRVPFLDHRLVEFTYSMPPELYEELFWDKTILREAMTRDLPEDLRQRPKVPFFVGEDERYTRRMVYSMLTQENNTLVEEALAGAADNSIFNADVMRQIVEDLPRDPEYTNVDLILDLVNMGLLSAMAKDMPDFNAMEAKMLVSAVEIGEWTEWEQRTGPELVMRTPALDTHRIVCFADGIRLVKREGGDPKVADEGDHYFLSNNELLFVLEAGLEKWVSFLRLVDGQRTIGKILEEANLQKHDVWKHLEESIEYGVLYPI